MAASGRKRKVDLLVEVPAAGRHFLHAVEVAPSSSTVGGAAQVTYAQLAQALVEGKLLPPEARYSFLQEDGSPIGSRLTGMVSENEAILMLTRAPGVGRPGKERTRRCFGDFILMNSVKGHSTYDKQPASTMLSEYCGTIWT